MQYKKWRIGGRFDEHEAEQPVALKGDSKEKGGGSAENRDRHTELAKGQEDKGGQMEESTSANANRMKERTRDYKNWKKATR